MTQELYDAQNRHLSHLKFAAFLVPDIENTRYEHLIIVLGQKMPQCTCSTINFAKPMLITIQIHNAELF